MKFYPRTTRFRSETKLDKAGPLKTCEAQYWPTGCYSHVTCRAKALWLLEHAESGEASYSCGKHSPEHARKIDAKRIAKRAAWTAKLTGEEVRRRGIRDVIRDARAVCSAYLSCPGAYPIEVSSAIAKLGRSLEPFRGEHEDEPEAPPA